MELGWLRHDYDLGFHLQPKVTHEIYASNFHCNLVRNIPAFDVSLRVYFTVKCRGSSVISYFRVRKYILSHTIEENRTKDYS